MLGVSGCVCVCVCVCVCLCVCVARCVRTSVCYTDIWYKRCVLFMSYGGEDAKIVFQQPAVFVNIWTIRQKALTDVQLSEGESLVFVVSFSKLK